MLYRVKYENERGQTIDFDSSPELKALTFDGFGDVEADVQSHYSPYQDGSRFIDSVLKERPIAITFMVSGSDENAIAYHRRNLSRVINPKIPGLLTVETGGMIFVINVVPEHVPSYPSGGSNQGRRYQKGVIDFIAHDPYWREPQEVSHALKAYEGLFSFPFNFPIEFGREGDSTVLANDGTVDATIELNIQGPVVNPIITNETTGEFIKLNRALAADEVLHVNTSPSNKRVEIYRGGAVIEKAWGFLDPYSSFFSLIPGDNLLSYKADSGADNAIAAIAWQNKYLGI
ncbi:phage distal tail protein [Rossellomorea marisflavi]|uniref:phage distal tail protein n=1 Tax=Rossellomorea marisflavi TaxID=189381 RepID=UPI0009A7A76C|nr:phage tail domain-containing protein [Rossellomorea marisflavi]